MLYPLVLDELCKIGYRLTSGKVLFVTALNSIKLSMVTSMKALGLECAALTGENFSEVLNSETRIVFISPEVLKMPRVSSCLLMHRTSFVLKGGHWCEML